MEKKPEVSTPETAKQDVPKRRRQYSAEEKARLLAEAEAPGGSVSLVARK